LTKKDVKKFYPDGLINYSQIIRDKHRSRWLKGEWTDDTDQFLCIMDSLLEKGKVDLMDIASRFYNWYKNEPRGIGNTTLKVLSMPQYVQYPQKAARLVWKLKGKNIAPNGALMRNAIVGIWQYNDQKEVHFNSSEICKLTHYDQRCVDSCIIHSHIISSELKNGKCDHNTLQELINTFDSRIKTYLAEYLTEDISTLELGDAEGMGYTLKSLSAALWAYLYAESFEEGLLAIINEGGDADTNGCIAASVLGAKFGFDTIPKRWVNGIYNVAEINNRIERLLKMIK
jgi:ADP-ribosylglycohydrolase